MELAIKVFLSAWFITNFEPITKHTHELYARYFNTPYEIGFQILTCFKCLSFWLVLAFAFDPFYAVGASFLASFYDEIKGR
jgi:hypothetical protein